MLSPSIEVSLWIAGFGFFNSLPLPMRESGGEAEMGTRELCRLFDDPIQKAAQWLRAGSPQFKIGPGKYAACRRWLALFGLESSAWPDELLYPLALLAPTLARMAGREVGIQLAFLVLHQLPVYKFHYRGSHRLIAPKDMSLLGIKANRLGRDFLVGDRQVDTCPLTVQLGPVSLDTYEQFQSESGRRLIEMTAELCMSAYQKHSTTWVVDSLDQFPCLGVAPKNSRLGLNFHLGQGEEA
jgi:predicted component of type VI protein secretion system